MFKKLLLSLLLLSACSLQSPIVYTTDRDLMIASVERIAPPTTQGYDVLGLAMYCKQFLVAPRLPALSTLMNTFGDPLPCVEQRIKLGGIEKIQIDLRDATCFRNHVCPSGTPSLTDWSVMLRYAQNVNRLAVKYPTIDWWISPWLEQDIKDEATVKKGCTIALQGCPMCKCINSPVSGARPAGIPIELHGTTRSAFSISSDGSSIFDGDNILNDGNNFQHRIAGSNQSYAWFNSLNLRCSGEKTFVPPLKRTNTPTADEFRQAYLTMITPEPPKSGKPLVCRSVRDVIPNKEINKPNAEMYCNGQHDDGRGNKPLLIVQYPGQRGDKINVFNSSGKNVGCFAYYGTYPDIKGAHRWYMGSCSGQTPSKLFDALSGEWGFVQLKDRSCIRFNAIRRLGTYR